MAARSLLLVSASPRRADLLRYAGYRFRAAAAGVDETPLPGESPGDLAERLARAKAGAPPAPPGPAVLIGADTVVAVEGEVLGKPADDAEARAMLRRLAGRTHEVTTGLAIRVVPEETVVCERGVSRVRFAPMTAEEIAWYAATGEGSDKAGGYALQGIGALFIAGVEGSYTNVIGLPMERVYPILRRFGVLPSP